MANIVLREPAELRRIMDLRGLTMTREGASSFCFVSDALAECQGARVDQNGEGRFCVTHTLRDGMWYDTGEESRMGECELLFYLEHLLPFARAAQAVNADVVSAVMNLWVDANEIPGMQWRVYQDGRYAGWTGWTPFDLSVADGPVLRFACTNGPKFLVRLHGANNWGARTMEQLHELFQTCFRGLPVYVSTMKPALAVLERVVAITAARRWR